MLLQGVGTLHRPHARIVHMTRTFVKETMPIVLLHLNYFTMCYYTYLPCVTTLILPSQIPDLVSVITVVGR